MACGSVTIHRQLSSRGRPIGLGDWRTPLPPNDVEERQQGGDASDVPTRACAYARCWPENAHRAGSKRSESVLKARRSKLPTTCRLYPTSLLDAVIPVY